MPADFRPVCVIVQPIAEAGLALLREAGLAVEVASAPDFAKMAPLLAGAVAAITRNRGFPATAMAAAPRLRVIGSHGAGTDAIDRAEAAARAIRIVNTPGENARSVAELTMGLILAAARGIVFADGALRQGETGFRERSPGLELAGRTLGLVGFGHVARHVAPMARAFGLRLAGFSRAASIDEIRLAGIAPATSLDELLAMADIISLHAAGGSPAMIGAREFGLMKPGAIFVNTARGSLVDEGALAEALAAKHLRAAALDVTAIEPLPASSPLLAAPNLILTPHLGGSTEAALERTSLAVARKVLDALADCGILERRP